MGTRAAAALRVAAAALPPMVEGAVVAGFHPRADEFDVLPLLARLRDMGHAIALPVVAAKAQPLQFRLWMKGEALVPAVMGIRVPAETAAVVEPDVLFVPLLEFDSHGYRLGYGGGFYDRTIARLRALKPVLTIGVGFAGQEVDEVPHDGHDMALDWLLTEDGLRRAGAAGGEAR
jgi:5-formyltetrahydrofolate cyclo-ligase